MTGYRLPQDGLCIARDRDGVRCAEPADRAPYCCRHWPTEPESDDVQQALSCVDAGNAGHWPTVAGVLAYEVRRLQAELRELAAAALRNGKR